MSVEQPVRVGFAGQRLRKRRCGMLCAQLITSAVLLLCIMIIAVAVSVGMTRAEPTRPLPHDPPPTWDLPAAE